MKRISLAVATLVVLVLANLACQESFKEKPGSTSAKAAFDKKASFNYKDSTLIKRGEYLVTVMVCDDCHSPKKMGPMGPEIIAELRLSGFTSGQRTAPVDTNVINKGWMLMAPDLTSFIGPWGQSFAANITSDSTGTGNWTFEQFETAIRKGKSKGLEGNRDLLPPMPWTQYRHLNEEDLQAIYSFLQSTPPVKNVVPAWRKINEL